MTDQSRQDEQRASRVAMVGIISCLVFTTFGMAFSSPVLGILGLASITVLVLLRNPIARALPRR